MRRLRLYLLHTGMKMLREVRLEVLARINHTVELLEFILEQFHDHTSAVLFVFSEFSHLCSKTAVVVGVPAHGQVVERVEESLVETKIRGCALDS